MSAAQPWMKFYPRDWRADERLRDCSLAARGLWIEMIAIMHGAERYGRLLIAGKPATAERLSRQVGASETEVAGLLDELREAGVFSVDASGIIYSRRMRSDEKAAETARKNGKLGGNPRLCNKSDISGGDKGGDKAADKDGLILRGQRPDKKTSQKKKIPDDWKPEPFGEDTEAGAIAATWDAKRLSGQLERFRDHHRAKGSVFSDWQAAWGTWVRNSVNFSRPLPGADPPSFLKTYQDELEREKRRQAATG